MIYHIRKLFWRIKNTWLWMRFAWNIRWYEYSQLYQTLRFFLQNMIRYFEGSRVQYVGIERDIEYMRLCIKLIDRLEFDYYEERAMEELEKRWGKYQHGISIIIDDGGIERNCLEFKRELEKTEEDEVRYNIDFVKTHNFWKAKHEKAKRLLHKILQEKIEYWWI